MMMTGRKAVAKKKSVLRDWAESLAIAFVLAMVIRFFIIESFRIPTGSMRPTLMEGDLILVNKFLYGARIPFSGGARLPAVRQPKRGDVIVFIFPGDPKKNFIKRLVATEGETVEIRKGTIYVNDKPLTEPFFSQVYYYNRGDIGREGERITVPAQSYFFLGDNSGSSQDSRYWGFVPKRNILGKALVIFWPPFRIRLIK